MGSQRAVDDDGWVMTGITVVHAARRQIYLCNKHRDEHPALITADQRLVESGGDILWREAFLGDVTEQIHCHRHRHRGGYTLTTHITHTEVQFVALQEEVVEVTTYFLGRIHQCIEIDACLSREIREDSRHHTHLYLAGNAQFTFDTLLRRRRLLQTAIRILQFLMGSLQFVVGSLYLLAVLVAAVEDKGEGSNNNESHDARHEHHYMVSTLPLFLRFHLCPRRLQGDREF